MVECQLTNVEGMVDIKKTPFGYITEVIDLGRNPLMLRVEF